MREAAVERFVAARPHEVEAHLSPERLIEYEGSFAVRDVAREDDATYVTAGARGVEVALRFERTDDGYRYEQVGEAGPFDGLWTRVSWAPEDEGSRVSARSGVSLGLPLPAVTDRVAAWKRRGELRRALDRLAEDLG